jgi:hypothetical protein
MISSSDQNSNKYRGIGLFFKKVMNHQVGRAQQILNLLVVKNMVSQGFLQSPKENCGQEFDTTTL